MFHNTQKIIYHKFNRIIIHYIQFNKFYPQQFIVSKKFFSSFNNDKHKTSVKQNNKEEIENLKKFVKIKNFEKAKIIFDKLKYRLTGETQLKAYNIFFKLIVDKDPENGHMFIKQMLENKITPDDFTVFTWMKAYCDKGKPEKAENILRNTKHFNVQPNSFMYNLLIRSFLQKGKLDYSLYLFKEMNENGIKPNIYTYTCIINALIKKEDMKSAMEIFNQMKLNDKPDVVA